MYQKNCQQVLTHIPDLRHKHTPLTTEQTDKPFPKLIRHSSKLYPTLPNFKSFHSYARSLLGAQREHLLFPDYWQEVKRSWPMKRGNPTLYCTSVFVYVWSGVISHFGSQRHLSNEGTTEKRENWKNPQCWFVVCSSLSAWMLPPAQRLSEILIVFDSCSS